MARKQKLGGLRITKAYYVRAFVAQWIAETHAPDMEETQAEVVDRVLGDYMKKTDPQAYAQAEAIAMQDTAEPVVISANGKRPKRTARVQA